MMGPDPDGRLIVPTTLTDSLLQRWTSFYETAHAMAELSHQEFRTTELIEAQLDELQVPYFRVSETGTVGVVRNGEGPTIAFRADIDALPVVEDTGLSYASTNGAMHACGHDTHFSALLGAVDYLLANRQAWAGTLVLIFQPAEESGSGALTMVEGGLWERAPRPEVLLAQHIGPMPAGLVATKSENVLSLSDTLWVTVRGRQAHGAQPQDGIDPVVAAAAIVTRLQSIVSRSVAPGAGVVVTVGTISAGTAPNIIPDTCEFTINVRTPEAEVRSAVIDQVRRILDAEALASGTQVTVERHEAFGRCYNDPAQTDRVLDSLRGEFGTEHTNVLTGIAQASEDVGELADAIGAPLVFWFFGSLPVEAFAAGAPPVNHSPHFAPDGAGAMATGIRAAVAAITGYLGT